MKVKDLFKLDGSWDVYENIADEIGIAFCNEGKQFLTEAGQKKFKVALEFPIARIDKDMIVIDTEKYYNDKGIDISSYDFEERSENSMPKEILNLIDLFWYLGGYCSVEEYEKYFIRE